MKTMKRLALLFALTLVLMPAAALADTIEFSYLSGTWGWNSGTSILTISNPGGAVGAVLGTSSHPSIASIGSSLSISTGPGSLPGVYPAGGNITVGPDWYDPQICEGNCLDGTFTDVQTVASTSIPGGYTFTANFLGGTIDQTLLSVLVEEGLFQGSDGINAVVGFASGNLSNGACSSVDGVMECNGALGSLDITVAPVPEPGTLTLLGTGLLALGGALRRKLAKS